MKVILFLFLLFMQFMNISLEACVNPKLTRPIIIDIFCSLTTCCRDIKQTVNPCNPTFIKQSDVGSTGFIITVPGVYFLSEDIQFAPGSPASAISIETDNVLLDLQCFIISQTNGTSGVNGITIGGETGRNNITIRNGMITGFTGDGINVQDGSSLLNFRDIAINFSNRGVAFEGSSLSPIIDVELTSLDLTSNTTGLAYYFTQAGLIQKCQALANTSAGYDIRTSFSNKFINCLARNTKNSVSDAFGVFVDSGANNIFEGWNIESISTSATFTGNTATGFFIGANEDNLTLKHSQVHNCVTTSSAQPFGIQMTYTFTGLFDTGVPTFTLVSTVEEIVWSNNARYMGVVRSGLGINQAQILEFSNNSLTPVALFSTGGVSLTGCDWSPDNKYFVAVESGSPFGVLVFEFNGTSLSLVATETTLFSLGLLDAAWSHNGRYIAVGGLGSLAVFEFTGSSLVLIEFLAIVGPVRTSVDWSPDDQFLAVSNSGSPQVQVFSFDGSSLTSVATFVHGAQGNQVAWSLDGKYLAFAGNTAAATTNRIFEFTGSALIQRASFDHGAASRSITWSPDGKFVGLSGLTGTGGVEARVLEFTGSSLISRGSFVSAGIAANTMDWSPNGQYIGLGSAGVSGVSFVQILTGLQFPQGCTILDNIVSGVHGVTPPTGVPWVSNGRGISASSASNLIIKNTAFDNDINFVFVTDVFQQFLVNVKSEVPSVIENLSFPPL